jgi:hypothetical protein
MEVFVSAKTRRTDFGQFKEILSSKVIKIPDPLPLSRIMACTLLSLSYAPGN